MTGESAASGGTPLFVNEGVVTGLQERVSASAQLTRSVDDEQLRSDGCRGAMRLGIVGDLVADARRQYECPAIFELGV